MKYTTQDVLAFIAAAERFPNSKEKEIYVSWLATQFELTCEAEVIKSPSLNGYDKYSKGDGNDKGIQKQTRTKARNIIS